MPENEQPQNFFKFDVYDIFGYLVPGTIFIIGVYAHANMFKMEDLLKKLKETFSYFHPFSDPWPEFLTTMSLFLLLAYIVGHLVALFSAAILDKWVIERIFGFPYERLFKDLYKNKSQSTVTSGQLSYLKKIKYFFFSESPSDYNQRKFYFYKSMMNISLTLLIYFAAISGTHDYIVLLLLISLIVLIILKLIFTKLTLPDIQDSLENRPAGHKLRIFANWLWKWIIQLWLKIFALLFDLWSNILLSLFRMRKPFTHEFQDKFVKKFKKTFLIKKPEKIGTDIFWLTYAYVCQNDPASTKLVHRWLCQYEFNRNLSISFFLLFIYGVVMHKFCSAEMYQAENYEYLSWCLITGISAVVFGLRYYYIYYNYFSKFVFRAFVSAVKNNRTGQRS